jgi:hypothetical protein
MTARRRPSVWANWRTLVHEPGQTAYRAETQVGALRLRPAPLSARDDGAADRVRRISRPDCPHELAGLLFLLLKIQDCLLRMPGPHDERGSTKSEASKEQVGAALSADRTRPSLCLPKVKIRVKLVQNGEMFRNRLLLINPSKRCHFEEASARSPPTPYVCVRASRTSRDVRAESHVASQLPSYFLTDEEHGRVLPNLIGCWSIKSSSIQTRTVIFQR